MTDKLTGLHAGNQIAVPIRGNSMRSNEPLHYDILTITRVTNASVFVGSRRFRRSDGYEAGTKSDSRWYSTARYAEPVTVAHKKANVRYLDWLDAINLHRRYADFFSSREALPIDLLREVDEVVTRHMSQNKSG